MTIVVCALLLLSACGPQIGNLERGEEARVVRAYAGDTLELEDGTRVFLAEIDAPRGDAPYAAQSQGELEALALHRDVLLAYGGARRWVGRPREGEETPREAAIAHVFVKSEGGRWFWLQHELVSRGAAYVRARPNNHARAAELLELEERARTAERGMWGQRAYRSLSVHAATTAAIEANANCLSGEAPFRIVEGRIAEARVFEQRASLRMEGAAEPPFSLVVFGDNFTAWDGPQLASLTGARVRARGPLGIYRDEPQLCLEHASQLEILTDTRAISRDKIGLRLSSSEPPRASAPAKSTGQKRHSQPCLSFSARRRRDRQVRPESNPHRSERPSAARRAPAQPSP